MAGTLNATKAEQMLMVDRTISFPLAHRSVRAGTRQTISNHFTHMRFAIILMVLTGLSLRATDPVIMPKIDGGWWPIAGDPDLGKLTTAKQQPVDFTVWQAADGTWQMWSCIRDTATPGNTRLFHRWQGANLTDRDWQPKGIVWQADPGFGEKEGGVQSPFVTKVGDEYILVYGDWDHICMARSQDGKTFARRLMPDGKSGMFTEGIGLHTRDPMLLRVGDLFYRSKDPTDFGVNDDQHFVTELPIAAPEIVECLGSTYVAALLPSLKGVQLARLQWVSKP